MATLDMAPTSTTTDPTADLQPSSTGYRRRGRPKSNFGPRLVSEILTLIEAGYGRSMVCQKLRIGPNRFRRILREKPRFAAAVRQAEAARSESCELQLLQLSQDEAASPNVRLRAAIAYLGRRERVEKARQQRRAQKEARDREDALQDEEEMMIRARAPRAEGWSSTFQAVYGRGDLDSPTATAPPPAAEPALSPNFRAPAPQRPSRPVVAAPAAVPPASNPIPAAPPAPAAAPNSDGKCPTVKGSGINSGPLGVPSHPPKPASHAATTAAPIPTTTPPTRPSVGGIPATSAPFRA